MFFSKLIRKLEIIIIKKKFVATKEKKATVSKDAKIVKAATSQQFKGKITCFTKKLLHQQFGFVCFFTNIVYTDLKFEKIIYT